MNEDKANAHAGMPLCGVSRFAVPAFKSVFGCMTKEQQPFWGVGRLCLSVIRHAQPHLGKCNDLRLFCIHTKFGEVFCGTGVNSIGVNNGAFNEF